jgi:hypothetical protein
MLYEAVENVELRDRPVRHSKSESSAPWSPKTRRSNSVARPPGFAESGRHDYAWWIVREPGMTLARWIADSTTSKEFVLDLRSGELVEYWADPRIR